ncbi:MAG: hypothetical protein JRJ31_16830 [Deltaproteobacteria bacterium]|nr:hypothetical protein [Deltaproteobacteria bacterium]
MNPPSEDIKDILEQSSVGVGTFGTDLFIGREPDSPNDCVTIYDTGGQEPVMNYTYDYPTVQIRVRGSRMGYKAAWTKANSIKEALNGLTNETWNSTRYIQIEAMGDPLFLGYDKEQRPVFVINFSIQRTA